MGLAELDGWARLIWTSLFMSAFIFLIDNGVTRGSWRQRSSVV